jgi:hypothetical protein
MFGGAPPCTLPILSWTANQLCFKHDSKLLWLIINPLASLIRISFSSPCMYMIPIKRQINFHHPKWLVPCLSLLHCGWRP